MCENISWHSKADIGFAAKYYVYHYKRVANSLSFPPLQETGADDYMRACIVKTWQINNLATRFCAVMYCTLHRRLAGRSSAHAVSAGGALR